MSVKKRFQLLAAQNGGNLFKFDQKAGLKQVGVAQSKGVCQAFCFFDGLLALAGFGPERTKHKDVVEYSVHFQKDFEKLSGAQNTMWDTKLLRAKYAECLGYMDMTGKVGVGYVETLAGIDELIGFLYAKKGYFNLLLPNHVTGYYQEGGAFRYFEPNAGTVSFASQQNAMNFISDFHSCDEFKAAYDVSTGDLIAVQMTAR
jgi:hypothetical protein